MLPPAEAAAAAAAVAAEADADGDGEAGGAKEGEDSREPRTPQRAAGGGASGRGVGGRRAAACAPRAL